jgi:uncharacterized protein (UPF0303 family)
MVQNHDIAAIARQEKALVFEKMHEELAWELLSLMRETAKARGMLLVMDVHLIGRQAAFHAMPGTSADNEDWVRRKANTVARFDKSSYRVALESAASNKAFDLSRGIDPSNFANAGGGFPIRVKSAGLVGSVTVSGAPQRVDHEFVVECLCIFLMQDYGTLRLPAETR